MMTRSTLHKLLLARRCYELAVENISSANEVSLGIGVNLLQDAVEFFLLAVSEHVHAAIQSKTHFDKYFELINSKIKPKELPFRGRLLALNKLRVNSKHHGLAPAQSETKGLVVTVREFFTDVTESILGKSFLSLSLIDLLRDGEAKDHLKEAEAAFDRNEFDLCLVNCRKAIYGRIESAYDISLDGHKEAPSALSLRIYGHKAPFYAKNSAYIQEHVKDPTDYVVLDHNQIEMDLMKSGMDSVSFWNVWRLTSGLWRDRGTGEWVVKREFAKLDADGLRERAEYVLGTTIDLFVAADHRIAATRVPDPRTYHVTLSEEQVPVYQKADTASKVVATTPKGLMKLYVDFMVPALKGNGNFLHVAHYNDDCLICGYLPEEAVADRGY